MLRAVLSGFLALLFVGSVHAELSNDRQSTLDTLLSKGLYDQMLRMVLNNYSKGLDVALTAFDPADIDWLRSKAEEGHVPLLYALALKTQGSDETEARKWNARAYVGLMLDSVQCVDPDEKWYARLESGLPLDIRAIRNKDKELWREALESALRWHKSRVNRVSARWICKGGNMLLPNEADLRRKTQIEEFGAFLKIMRATAVTVQRSHVE